MVRLGGASLVERAPVFSTDGKRLLLCTASTVSVYSVATGLLITQLHGHTAPVTSAVVVQAATVVTHVWTSSLDGTIRLWDFTTGVLLTTVHVGLPILSMVIPDLCTLPASSAVKSSGSKLKNPVAFLSVHSTKKEQNGDWNTRIICFNLTSRKPIPGHLAKLRSPGNLVVSPAGGLVGLADGFKIWVWKVPTGSLENARHIQELLLHHTAKLLQVTFDATETRVAGGDENGRILIWENVGEHKFSSSTEKGGKEKKSRIVHENPTTNSATTTTCPGVRGSDDAAALTKYHWHSREVQFLIFSSDGVYLLSGGLEGVLVIWQLETGKCQFLPRLGGPLVSIAASPNPSLYAIACLDNAVKFVNIGTLSIERSIQGIKPPVPFPKNVKLHPLRASIEPYERKMVLPTQNISLQFYDTANDQHVGELQVVPRNYLSEGKSKNRTAQLPSTFVSHVAFSADGTSMATVDIGIPEQGIGGGACLKFWDRPSRQLQYSVNTQVDELHEIAALVFHPRELLAVTCCHSDFKVWVPTGTRRNNRTSWRCRSVGSYRQKPMLAAAFSSDGTILAVGAAELITLWNPSTNEMIRVLASSSSAYISLLAFVNHSNCLVAASSGIRGHLTVWDLSTLTVSWDCSMHVEALAVDPVRPNFAVLATLPYTIKNQGFRNKDSVVALFGVDSPSPTRYWSLRDGIGGTILFFPESVACLALPSAQPALEAAETKNDNAETDADSTKSTLVILTRSREFALLNPYDEEYEHKPLTTKGGQVPDTNVLSAFSSMYGKVVTPKKPAAGLLSAVTSKAPWGSLLEGPSHVLPPLTRICIPFMESLLQKQRGQS